MSLGEDERDDSDDGMDAIVEGFHGWDFEREIKKADAFFCPSEALGDGGFLSEEGASDFSDAEAAEGFQGEQNPFVRANVRVAADEEEAKRVVIEFCG